MSAFFLIKGCQEQLLEKAQQAFVYRKMTKFKSFNVSCGKLLLAQKELIDDINFVTNGTKGLYCIGTPVYKANSYKASLQQIFSDLETGEFDFGRMRGNFVMLYDNGKETMMIRDARSMFKLFSDIDGSYITSSFLAATAVQPVSFNDNAVVEQLLYGFVAAPDTLLNEVRAITNVKTDSKLNWINNFDYSSICSTHQKGQKARCQEIVDYMKDVAAYVKEYGAECGLSGGCDSRLIFASVNEVCGKMNSVHTHCTSDIHNKEIKTVQQLAEIKDTPVRIIPTTYLPECDSLDIDETLQENVLYFDGRNANIIGACSQTHTRSYKEKTSEGSGITFSGIGGEIYRDFYHTGHTVVFLKSWLHSRLFYGYVRDLVPTDIYSNSLKNILKKVRRDTGLGSCGIAPWRFARRFFDNYRIPHALSNVVNANNQMKFYIAPFVENSLIEGAKRDNFIQEHCGKYEGDIIGLFNSELAGVMSSKGYPLNKVPLKERIKWFIRSFYPSYFWSLRTRSNCKPGKSFAKLLSKSSYLQISFDYFKKKFPNWNLSASAIPDSFMQNFVFTLCTLKEIEQITIVSK